MSEYFHWNKIDIIDIVYTTDRTSECKNMTKPTIAQTLRIPALNAKTQ